jgi:hypothetical protein
VHIERVKKYVASSLVCAVLLLHALAVAAIGAVQDDVGGSRVGLFILSVLFALLGIVAVRLINRIRVLTPWLLCAVLPATVFYVVWFRVLDH